jgi:hypothetical protein
MMLTSRFSPSQWIGRLLAVAGLSLLMLDRVPAQDLIVQACPESLVLTLRWDQSVSTSVAGYRVYFGPTRSTATRLIRDLPVNLAGFDPAQPAARFDAWNELGLGCGSNACFAVTAYNETGESAPAQAVCAAIGGSDGVGVNARPTVVARADQLTTTVGGSVSLGGVILDDGLPSGTITLRWDVLVEPGFVSFGETDALDTTVTFYDTGGRYVFQLAADDGVLIGSDMVTVVVAEPVAQTQAPVTGVSEPQPVLLTPEADALTSEFTPGINYGDARSFLLTPFRGYPYEGYFRFDLSAVTGPVSSARLRLYPTYPQRYTEGSEPAALVVSFVANDGWDEGTITWNSAAAAGLAASEILSVSHAMNGPLEIDVTDLVLVEVAGDQRLSLKVTSVNDTEAVFNSREAFTNPPVLVITTE